MCSMLLKTVAILSIFVVVVYSTQHLCGTNEEWTEWIHPCSAICEFPNPPCENGTMRPPPGCACKPEYIYLNSEKKVCVKRSECPKTCSKPLFIWNDCGTRCPLSCLHPEPTPCVERCQFGCFCPEEYIINDWTNECVKRKDCPTCSI